MSRTTQSKLEEEQKHNIVNVISSDLKIESVLDIQANEVHFKLIKCRCAVRVM